MLGCDLGPLCAQAGGEREAGDVRLELNNQDTALGELRRQVMQLPHPLTPFLPCRTLHHLAPPLM